METDKLGLYKDGDSFGVIEQTDAKQVAKVAEKIRELSETQLTGMNIYYSAIPDKSVYSSLLYGGYDPELVENTLRSSLGAYTYIDLYSVMNADMYYNTDLHWDQTKLAPVLAALGMALEGVSWSMPDEAASTAGEFTGVYPGQFAARAKPDVLRYYDLSDITALYLTYSENRLRYVFEEGPVYDSDAFDSYDFFLCGTPQIIVKIRNPENVHSEKTLYIFRDSFASSLAPLIGSASDYYEIVLIDLRWISSDILNQFLDIRAGSDILFLYSSVVLNDASLIS